MIVGYRAWVLDGIPPELPHFPDIYGPMIRATRPAHASARLRSTAAPYLWSPGKNRAAHIPAQLTVVKGCWCDGREEHAIATGYGNYCGFWAYNTPQLAVTHDHKRDGDRIVGAILGWGHYQIAEYGFRCEFARIIALSDAMFDEMDELSQYYGVPVTTWKGLREFAEHLGTPANELDTTCDTFTYPDLGVSVEPMTVAQLVGATTIPLITSGGNVAGNIVTSLTPASGGNIVTNLSSVYAPASMPQPIDQLRDLLEELQRPRWKTFLPDAWNVSKMTVWNIWFLMASLVFSVLSIDLHDWVQLVVQGVCGAIQAAILLRWERLGRTKRICGMVSAPGR